MLTLFIRQRLRSEHCSPNPSGLCGRVPVDQFSWLAHNPEGEAWFIPLKSVKTEPKHIHLRACLLLQMHAVTRILSGTRCGNLTNGGANTLIHKWRISTQISAFRNLKKKPASLSNLWCMLDVLCFVSLFIVTADYWFRQIWTMGWPWRPPKK